MDGGIYLALDDAFDPPAIGLPLSLPVVDACGWGPKLRYLAPAGEMEQFSREVTAKLPSRVLYGSGDFHHLSGSFVRRWAAQAGEPVTLVSFDNHPDWDIRPPLWGCGGWVSRALRFANVSRASVWGCGNFELALPARLFRDRGALRSGRLVINAWAERQTDETATRFDCMRRDDWRARFARFVEHLAGQAVYLTVDLDCLKDGEIMTNWENGLFTADEVCWAIGRVRESARMLAGDVCGCRSTPVYARSFQRFAGQWDHPKLPDRPMDEIRRHNAVAVSSVWRALTE